MITGEHTILRAIEGADLEPLRAWRNQPHLRRYFREYREISPEMQQRWFEKTVLGDPNTRMFAITEKSSGRLLGAAGICWIDWRNRSGDFSIYLGADDLYVDDVFAPDAGRLLLRYGFEELGLGRVWAEIWHTDEAKQVLFPSLGFVLEGRHRSTTYKSGEWVDSLFWSILAEEYAANDHPARIGVTSD